MRHVGNAEHVGFQFGFNRAQASFQRVNVVADGPHGRDGLFRGECLAFQSCDLFGALFELMPKGFNLRQKGQSLLQERVDGIPRDVRSTVSQSVTNRGKSFSE